MRSSIRQLLLVSFLAATARAAARFNFTALIHSYEADMAATSGALVSLIDAYFTDSNLTYSLYTYREGTQRFRDIVNEMGRRSGAGFVLRTEALEFDPDEDERRLSAPGLVFLRDEHVDEFVRETEIDAETSTGDFKLLVYCENCEARSVSKYMQFLNDDGATISLTVLDLFTSRSDCRTIRPVILNRFHKSSLRWERRLRKVPHIRSFNRCPVFVLVRSSVWLKYKNSNINEVHRMFEQVIGVMEEVGNFSANFTVERVEIGSAMTVIKTGIDFRLTEGFQVTENLAKSLEGVLAFCEAKMVGVLTSGELYSQYEKLFLPFDEATWALLTLVFVFTFAVIFVVNFMPRRVQDVIYGSGVNTPTLNVVMSFFGIGQTILPAENFPRIILTLFVWFCLIFRTAHQSKLFEYITSEPRRPVPNTEERIIQEYNSLESSLYESLHRITYKVHSSRIRTAKVVNALNRVDEMQQRFCNTHNNGSAKLVFLFNYYEDFIPVRDKCGTASHVMDQQVVFVMGITLDRNNPFYEILHETMMRIVPAGIPQKLHKDISQALTIQVGKTGEAEPKVLTMDDLGFGFVIVVAASGVATICFFCELAMWPLIQRRKQLQEGTEDIELVELPASTGAGFEEQITEFSSQDSRSLHGESHDNLSAEIEAVAGSRGHFSVQADVHAQEADTDSVWSMLEVAGACESVEVTPKVVIRQSALSRVQIHPLMREFYQNVLDSGAKDTHEKKKSKYFEAKKRSSANEDPDAIFVVDFEE